MIVINRCGLCKGNEKSIKQLFLKFPFSFQILTEVLGIFKMHMVLLGQVAFLPNQWSFNFKNSLVKEMWKLDLPHALWGIWIERNNMIFRNKESTLEKVIEKVKQDLKYNTHI